MARAYEYRMLRRYESELNLDDLFDQFISIGEANIGNPEPYVLDADQFHSLKAIYEDKIAVVAQTIFEDYNTNPPELSVPVRFNLTQDELDRLNAGQPLSLNLMDIGLFPTSEENVRIVDFEIASIEAHLEGGNFSRWANLNLYIEHSGISNLMQKGKLLQFRHYNAGTTNPIVWGARYDWWDKIIDPIKPSAASDSLLRSLLESDMAEDMMLYSRPSAWANLAFRKEVNSDNGVDIVIDSLRLKLTYDFMRKASDPVQLEVLVSQNGATPYVIVDRKDMNERQDGRGAFRRVYPRGQTVSLAAQEQYGRWKFAKWTDRYGYDISGQDPTRPEIALTLAQRKPNRHGPLRDRRCRSADHLRRCQDRRGKRDRWSHNHLQQRRRDGYHGPLRPLQLSCSLRVVWNRHPLEERVYLYSARQDIHSYRFKP